MAWTPEDYERLGDYIVSARLARGMDRGDLAAGADISGRTLADIENGELGKRRAFSSETLEAIALCVGWKPGAWRRILNGQEPVLVETVGGGTEDLGYVASSGDRAPDGDADADVLAEVRAMREEQRRLLERLEALEQQGP